MKCSWTDFMDFSWIICSLKFNLCSSIFIKYSWTNLLNFSWTDKFVKQSIVFSWRIHECSWTTKLIQKKFMNWFIVHHNSLYVHEPNSWISMNNGSWTTFEIFHELNMNYSWTFMNIHERLWIFMNGSWKFINHEYIFAGVFWTNLARKLFKITRKAH